MAWNPIPEVAVARDAANRLGEIHETDIKHCIVLYTTDDGRIGCSSYGNTLIECTRAKQIADRVYDAAMKYFSGKE